MTEPLFWLGLSILLVAVSLTAILVAALPAFRELARAARSAEKLFDTLSRELPPTLDAIRLTGLEITDLTDDVSEGVQSANRVAKQVDQSIRGVKRQARNAQTTTRSVVVGFKAAWRAFKQSANSRRPVECLSAADRSPLEFDDRYPDHPTDGFDHDTLHDSDRNVSFENKEFEDFEDEALSWRDLPPANESRSVRFSNQDYED